jgi:rod shape-determining protein MreD
MDLRWILLILSNYLLLFLLAEINHLITPWHLHLFPAGLLITYAAMRLNYRAALFVVIATGLLLDAGRPVPWGTQLFALLALHGVILVVRARIGFGELHRLIVLSIVLTPVHLLIITGVSLIGHPQPGALLGRATWDILMSTGLTALAAPWWFALQAALLALVGFDRRDEEAEIV